MTNAEYNKDAAGSARQGGLAAVVISPLLNLAPSRATGPTLNQVRAVLPLGSSGLSGTAVLSLAPDRRSVGITLQLQGGAPAAIHLRRIGSQHLSGASGSQRCELLIIEVTAEKPARAGSDWSGCFDLTERTSFLPFERVSNLRDLKIGLSELVASSIDGLSVEAAPGFPSAAQTAPAYFEERMIMEIKAAERSGSVTATCKHLELANLYARRLRSFAAPLLPPEGSGRHA